MKGLKAAFWGNFLVWLLIDQLVKAWARLAFRLGEAPGYPIPGIFELTLTYNEGIAFGFMKGHGAWFAPVALLITWSAMQFSRKHPHESGWVHMGLGLLSAGAIGNLIDRVWLNRVTDMFWIRAINFPVFNVADAAITVGAILIGIRFVFEKKQEEAEKLEAVPDDGLNGPVQHRPE